MAFLHPGRSMVSIHSYASPCKSLPGVLFDGDSSIPTDSTINSFNYFPKRKKKGKKKGKTGQAGVYVRTGMCVRAEQTPSPAHQVRNDREAVHLRESQGRHAKPADADVRDAFRLLQIAECVQKVEVLEVAPGDERRQRRNISGRKATVHRKQWYGLNRGMFFSSPRHPWRNGGLVR